MRIPPDWPAAIVCIVVGISISTLPHLIAWKETGRTDRVADHDERYYLAIGAQAYANHPERVTDPARAVDSPSLYKPLPLMPGIWTARVLGLGPLGIGLAWRIWAGAMIGVAWYVLLRREVAKPWLAAAMAVVLLSDSGLLDGLPVVRQVIRVLGVASGRPGDLFDGKPIVHPEWRIGTPGLTMIYLIALIWTVSRVRENPTRGRIIAAGLAFGLLFYVYFYYWTAAGLALLIALALDVGRRRVYFHVGWIGGLIGLPGVVSDYLMKRATAPDWLLRSDKFLPIGRFDELIIPKVLTVLLIVGLVWVWTRRRDMLFVWSLAAAALILTNHQLITKLQLENFHWSFVWGPATSLLVVVAVADELRRRPTTRRRLVAGATGVLALAMAGTGLWLRALETTRSRECIENTIALADYRLQRPRATAPPLIANAVVAGDPDFIDFAAIIDNLRSLSNYTVTLSPTVTNVEWEERIALEEVLLGLDRSRFEGLQRQILDRNHWGPWGRDPSLRAARLVARLDAFDRVEADLPGFIAKYDVRYVALPPGLRPNYLDSGWTRIEASPILDLWEREIPSAVD